MEIIEIITKICTMGIVFITFISTIVFLGSRIRYRPYRKSSQKNLMLEIEILSERFQNKDLSNEERRTLWKRWWQARVAFDVEFFDPTGVYLRNFNCPDNITLEKYYNNYIKDNGELTRRDFIGIIYQYVCCFLQRKTGNIYSFYFMGELLAPTFKTD